MLRKFQLKNWNSKLKKYFSIGLIKSFLIKHHDLILLVSVLIISLLGVRLATLFLYNINSDIIFIILLFYLIFFSLVYFSLSDEQRNKINKHQVFWTILSLVIPVLLFFWQASSNHREQFLIQEVVLKEDNNRNTWYLEEIIKDFSNDNNSNTILWKDFSTENYKKYWDHIQLKSQDCKDLYMALTVQLDILNNINQMRRELVLVPNSLYKDMLGNASSAKVILYKIIGECQSF